MNKIAMYGLSIVLLVVQSGQVFAAKAQGDTVTVTNNTQRDLDVRIWRVGTLFGNSEKDFNHIMLQGGKGDSTETVPFVRSSEEKLDGKFSRIEVYNNETQKWEDLGPKKKNAGNKYFIRKVNGKYSLADK